MPEAVASDSTTAPDRQHIVSISRLRDNFDDVRSMLKTFNAMTCALLETTEDESKNSYGLHLLHGLVMERLDEFSHDVEHELEARQRSHKLVKGSDVDRDLRERIGSMVADAYCSAGRNMTLDTMADWSIEDSHDYVTSCANYYRELIAKLEGETELLEVGSLLPWLEMKIRTELSAPVQHEEQQSPTPQTWIEPRTLRDRFILEMLKEGYPLSHISQALNVRVTAIEKAIQRLTGSTTQEAKSEAA